MPEKREAKGKEGERYTQLNAEFWRIARRDKKALREQFKKQRKTIEQCIADPVLDTSCFAVSHCPNYMLNPEQARCKLRGLKKTPGALGTADTSILLWLAQQLEPQT